MLQVKMVSGSDRNLVESSVNDFIKNTGDNLIEDIKFSTAVVPVYGKRPSSIRYYNVMILYYNGEY